MNGDAEWHLPQIPNGPPAESTITRQAERIRALESERDKFAEGSAEAMKKHLEQFTRAETAEAKVRELEAERDKVQKHLNSEYHARKAAESQLTAAQQALETAREGLEPFANFAPPRYVPDNHPMTNGSPLAKRQVTAADFRRAAEAYETLLKLKGKADV